MSSITKHVNYAATGCTDFCSKPSFTFNTQGNRLLYITDFNFINNPPKSLSMLVYSRMFLLSLRNSSKILNKISTTSHGSFHRPVPNYLWERLASYNLLAQRRGKRGGQQLRRSYNQAIKTVALTDRNRKRQHDQSDTKRTNLLNIQGDTFKAQRYTNTKQRNGHVPTNCIQIPTTTDRTDRKPTIPSLLVTNACHIKNKINELQGVIGNNNVTMSIITESWLSSDIPNSSTSIGMNLITYRKDREISQAVQ